MNGGRTYARSPDVLWRRVVDEIVVLTPASEGPAVLSAAAALVWESLEDPASPADLAGRLAPELRLEPGAMQAELERSLAELHAAGLVVMALPAEAAGV